MLKRRLFRIAHSIMRMSIPTGLKSLQNYLSYLQPRVECSQRFLRGDGWNSNRYDHQALVKRTAEVSRKGEEDIQTNIQKHIHLIECKAFGLGKQKVGPDCRDEHP